MSLSRSLPVFSAVFLIVYAISMHFNLAPFSYYPLVGRFAAGVAPATAALGPSMYWYGWLTNALVISLPVAVIAGFLSSERFITRAAPAATWISILVIAFFMWDLRSWFIR
ncbi:MAG TPA: hypothetical protein VHY80_11770 [Stellaceae bacterium]|jgi:hypothetical protein|nr:hypothetical protein [Stellaceae bacterium]